MSPWYPSYEDAPVVMGDRSTLRRRAHIRRAPGSPDTPLAKMKVNQRGPRRASAPANIPSDSHAGPSTSRMHNELYRASLASSPAVTLPRPKPYLHPIITSDLSAVPKMRAEVQITSVPTKTPKPSSRKTPPTSRHSERSSHSPEHGTSTHSNISVKQTSKHSARPLPVIPSHVSNTVVQAPPAVPAPGVVPGSTSSRKSTKKSLAGSELSSFMSPATIWSQQSAPLTGVPPSRRASLFVILTESRRPDTVPGADFQRKTTLDRLLDDWSHVDQVLQGTVIDSVADSGFGSGSGSESESENGGSGGGSNSETTITKEDVECDNAPSSSSSSTPTTVGPPTPAREASAHILATSTGTIPKQARAVPFSSAAPRKPRYDGPWGRAAAPSESGNGSTIGNLLMERWARAYAGEPTTTATPGAWSLPHSTDVAVQ